MASDGYPGRREWSEKIQKSLAVPRLYPRLWPKHELMEVDTMPDALAKAVDIAGGDKLFQAPDGSCFFTGNRFRQHNYWTDPRPHFRHRDFTLRECELDRHLKAHRNNGFIPGFYITGFVNETEDDFIAVLVVDYKALIRDYEAGLFGMGHTSPKNGKESFYHIRFRCFKNELLQYAVAKYYRGKWYLEPNAT